MTQYKGQGDPDYDEFIPYTPGVPIVVSGRVYNPTVCSHLSADDGTLEDGDHKCVHDWRVYWGVQKRVI